MPNEEGTWPATNSKQKPPDNKKLSKKFTGLPAPPLTRARAKANVQHHQGTIESIFCSVEEQLAEEYPRDEHTLPQSFQLGEDLHPHDPFLAHRYSSRGYDHKLHVLSSSPSSRLANLDYQDTTLNGNSEWTHLQNAINYLGLVPVSSFTYE